MPTLSDILNNQQREQARVEMLAKTDRPRGIINAQGISPTWKSTTQKNGPDFTPLSNNLKPQKPADEKLWPVDRKWSDDDKQREALALGLLGVDWAQTRHMARNFENTGQHEQNPILGRKPDTDKIDAYFGVVGLTQLYLADKLSDDWRRKFQEGLIALELGAAANNARLGIKTRF